MTATTIAQFNAQQQAAFIHHPRSPQISEPQSDQRYFNQKNQLEVDLKEEGKRTYSVASTDVMRFASHNYARVSMNVRTAAGNTSTTTLLTPTELRDLASRLIDAANDIELWPAARLTDYASMCSAPQEVAA